MFFSFVADLLTTAITVLLPIFMSYKALRTSDPAHLTPWLMYWVVLSAITAVESTFYFILGWIPFYAWLRFLLHLYLILPGSQGATKLYQEQVHPFLLHHETEIDQFIGDAHEKLRKAGLEYAKLAVEWVKVHLLGQAPRPPTPPASRQGSYAQQLFAQFNLPSARQGLAAPAGDFVGLLASALQYTTSQGQSREDQAQELSRSGTLIPQNIQTNAERMSYVSAQRERLNVLLSAFDREAYNLSTAPPDAPPRDVPGADLSKSRSETDFFKVEKEHADGGQGQGPQGQGGWMPWNWSRQNTGAASSAAEWVRDRAEEAFEERRGKSSGFDAGR